MTIHSQQTVYRVNESKRESILISLRNLALLKWGRIEPIKGKSWDECLTVLHDGRMALWFNTPDHSTHIERA